MFTSSSQNECRVKYQVQIINLRAVPQHMHDHVTYNQRAVPQINLEYVKQLRACEKSLS